MKRLENYKNKNFIKILMLVVMLVVLLVAIVVSVSLGQVEISFLDAMKLIFIDDGSTERTIVFDVRLPRILCAVLVGACLALAGVLLQAVLRNSLASPSTIGVTSGASFVGYIVLIVAPAYSYLLPIGSIIGAFVTTMLIYLLAYQKGVSPMKMILAGMVVSTVFSGFINIITVFFADELGSASAFMVGGFNGLVWSDLWIILPYALIGIAICMFIPRKLNILVLGDETSNSLGVKTERFRFFLIVIASLLAGASIAIAGLISFVGLIIPHIARLIIGSDHKFLIPASCLLGAILLVVCDTIGRTFFAVGEINASIILAFIGAPFLLFLLRKAGN